MIIDVTDVDRDGQVLGDAVPTPAREPELQGRGWKGLIDQVLQALGQDNSHATSIHLSEGEKSIGTRLETRSIGHEWHGYLFTTLLHTLTPSRAWRLNCCLGKATTRKISEPTGMFSWTRRNLPVDLRPWNLQPEEDEENGKVKAMDAFLVSQALSVCQRETTYTCTTSKTNFQFIEPQSTRGRASGKESKEIGRHI